MREFLELYHINHQYELILRVARVLTHGLWSLLRFDDLFLAPSLFVLEE